MPGGSDNEVNALYAIACSTGEMAVSAGGVAVANFGDNEDALAMAIACNLYATIGGLGGDCVPTWVDGATAWQAILQMSAQLATLTGTGSDQGFYELPQQGAFCNLQQVAINTGGAAEGDFGGNEGDLTLLNSIACVVAQIAANGFGPVANNRVLLNDGTGFALTNSGDHVLLNS